jgi:hypothetical protein
MKTIPLALLFLFSFSSPASFGYSELLKPASADFNVRPLRNPARLRRQGGRFGTPQKVSMLRVFDTRVILADYALLKRDFPQLRGRRNQDIDSWLSYHFGYIAQTQVDQDRDGVQSRINLRRNESVEAYRPYRYGRAVVFEIEEGGQRRQLMDGKGYGAVSPRQRHHRNGLATLGECAREFYFSKMVRELFRVENFHRRVVGTYAVLDPGFDVVHADGSKSAAGFILRQAHSRSNGPNSTLSERAMIEIETLVRRFGVTSAGELWGTDTSGRYNFYPVNIQGTPDGHIIDFGTFLVLPRFTLQTLLPPYPTMDLPEHQRRYQPEFRNLDVIEEHRRVPYATWGTSTVHDPKKDRPWVYAHDAARAFRQSGRRDYAAFHHQARTMLRKTFREIRR